VEFFSSIKGGGYVENRIAVVSIIIEEPDIVSEVNDLLHAFANHISGRLGIPYRDRGIAIICIVMDAPADVISSLSGKLGMLKGVRTKTTVAKQKTRKEG